MKNNIPLDEILTLAEKLIKIPSVADNIAALNEVLLLIEKHLSQFTQRSFIYNGKSSLLFHNAQADAKQFTILLNAHLDVVQSEKKQFHPLIRNGKLYGRGAYDMKAAAAVMIVLFKNFARHIPYPLALQITTDEETGTMGAKKQIDDGYRASFVIAGECGSNFNITNKAKGIYHIKITTKGTMSHSAYPWRGDNAIIKLQKVFNIINKQYPLPRDEVYSTTVTVTRIGTNNVSWNRIPDEAEAFFDIRYMPEDQDILQKLRTLLPKDIMVESLPEYSYLPVNTDPQNPYIIQLQQAGKSVLKKDIPLRISHATSDLVRFAAAGCDGVEFGPIGSNQHGDNEWVDVKSLGDYYQILKQFLLSVK